MTVKNVLVTGPFGDPWSPITHKVEVLESPPLFALKLVL